MIPEWQQRADKCGDMRTWDAWADIHQPFELDWWKVALSGGAHVANDQCFREVWYPVREFVKPHGVVIDIGAGPRPPFLPGIVIDPLATQYQDFTPQEWWSNAEVYARPAEECIAELRGTGDTIICWNCLDHTIGWRSILDNIAHYARPSAIIAIATDFQPPFIGHPGFERDELMSEIRSRFSVLEIREPFQRELALKLQPL